MSWIAGLRGEGEGEGEGCDAAAEEGGQGKELDQDRWWMTVAGNLVATEDKEGLQVQGAPTVGY